MENSSVAHIKFHSAAHIKLFEWIVMSMWGILSINFINKFCGLNIKLNRIGISLNMCIL